MSLLPTQNTSEDSQALFLLVFIPRCPEADQKFCLIWKIGKTSAPFRTCLFRGKLIEKSAAERFSGNIKYNNQDELVQSAYTELHDVKTALLVAYMMICFMQ